MARGTGLAVASKFSLIATSLVMVLEGMVRFTAIGCSDAPGPVSPHMYWSSGAGYEQLTSVSEDGKLSIRVGPAFQAVLEAVMSGD
ncbi:hypothetical protein [Paenarthrobacter aurescens]|uniref:hypothetical protein n=1 Tax=Paenarthrobacter aurescens TaxID=43663 RepID=UPI0021C0FDE4|nr:hypothetical protein [Paenarthrobacter aurescens]MCT9871838.1 hypothetical protein [Paenarthrobacter aurescens]